ncbi:hypothetical protein [Hymenobacter cavernae]|uniref:Uncharacterized protein n=1 Tax=Hymenobacter cavernae TaxID=2044852 RepID=A0ABQ1TLS0_9BACT|nr:hypothetical protein [Hymenobacter cavernae]GGE97007.1 hypothetical protein GCM10011383_04680 [Hymenobacter cavernae]
MRLVPFILLLIAFVAIAPRANAQLYDVRGGTVNFDRKERDALKVQVDGTAAWTRDFWQSWLKDTYNIKLKGDGVFGVGKKDVLVAKQTPASSVSGKLIDLYSMVTSPADTISELSVFADLGSNTWINPDRTPSEYAALRTIVQSFGAAARRKAYQEQLAEAEKQLRESEKEKEKLQKEITTLQANTTSNLAKIESLKQQNVANTLKAREDSVKVITTGQQIDLRNKQLQRRRDRLEALNRK